MPARRKIDGFIEAVHASLGYDAEPFVKRAFYSVEGGNSAASRLLDNDVTAIVCGSDIMARGAVRAVRRRGLSFPTDVSVIGFDDSPLMAFTDPPLTTVRQPVDAMGLAAVDALADEIQGHAVDHGEYLFETQLILRGSTGRLSVGSSRPRLRGSSRTTARRLVSPRERLVGPASSTVSTVSTVSSRG